MRSIFFCSLHFVSHVIRRTTALANADPEEPPEFQLFPTAPNTLNVDDWNNWSANVPGADYAEGEPEDAEETLAVNTELWNNLDPRFRADRARPSQLTTSVPDKTPSQSQSPSPAPSSEPSGEPSNVEDARNGDWLVEPDDEEALARRVKPGYDADEIEYLDLPIDQLAFYYLCGLVQPIVEERELMRSKVRFFFAFTVIALADMAPPEFRQSNLGLSQGRLLLLYPATQRL